MKAVWIVFLSMYLPLIAGGSTFSGEAIGKNLHPEFIFDHTADLMQNPSAYPPEILDQSIDKVTGIPFNECLTLQVKEPGPSPYTLCLQFFHTNQWQAGDTGLIAFWCRTLDSENRHGASSFKLQYKPDYEDWRGHLETDLFLSKEWRLITLPFAVSIEAAETPQNVLSFFLGGVDPHTFQLAGLRVYGFGPSQPLSGLPRSAVYYPGMEGDAAWRRQAHERIEQLRKADCTLTLTGAEGQPVAGATVEIRLKRHRFGFGAAIRTPLLVSPETPEEIRAEYTDILTRSCSKITPTNAMKWRLYSHFEKDVPALIQWCKEHEMMLRGHLLIWPGYDRLPAGYDLYKTDPEAFRKDLVNHIETFVNLYPDSFDEWDVLNEPYSEHEFMDLLGTNVVLEWFETARKANPHFLTYINDYGILSDNNEEHRDNYYNWISYLQENAAPLDGIGFQGHFRDPIPPELILERINHFTGFGKRMQITEFDFDHSDPALQARFFEDFVTLIYSHPQMDALINWIYLEDEFRPAAALYRKDFSPTPMGKVWERLLTEDWNTAGTVHTDGDGRAEFRGFKGTYEITVTAGERTAHHIIHLDQDNDIHLKL